MYKPNNHTLRLLRNAVKTQRAARHALEDLSCGLSENSLSEQMLDTLRNEIEDLELNDARGVPIMLETLERLLQTLAQESP